VASASCWLKRETPEKTTPIVLFKLKLKSLSSKEPQSKQALNSKSFNSKTLEYRNKKSQPAVTNYQTKSNLNSQGDFIIGKKPKIQTFKEPAITLTDKYETEYQKKIETRNSKRHIS